MINICVPTLKRYDLLRGMIKSCLRSDVKPDRYYIIDNGRNGEELLKHIHDLPVDVALHTPPKALGIAKCWNWFIDKAPQERIIVNDDIEFAPDSISKLVASKADLVWAKGCGFSCFVLRDACVQKLGRFDETISPDYGYYEDDDYLQRLDGRGTKPRAAEAEEVDADVVHLRSSTLKVASHDELLEHDRLFKLARLNYVTKWNLFEEFEREGVFLR